MRIKHTLITLGISFLSLAAYPQNNKNISTTYPHSYSEWQEAFLAGNGKTGIMVFGNPYHETIIFNSRHFNLPRPYPRTFAKVPEDTVARISELCAQSRFKEANDLAVRSSEWNDGGEGSRHPGFCLKIDMDKTGIPENYTRTCDFSTGEISVDWSDRHGTWSRKSFVSRKDDVAVVKISEKDKKNFSCAISLEIPDNANFPDGIEISRNNTSSSFGIKVMHAPPMQMRGFEGLVDFSAKDGKCEFRNDTLFISDATEITLITGIGIIFDSGTSFSNKFSEYLSDNYETLLERHTGIHSNIFNRVRLDLKADPESRCLSNEELLKMQKEDPNPVAALWERLFNSGRYHFLSSSSELTPPDLLGIWTGDCNAGWGGYYHLDANLNLQVAGGNIGDMPEAMEGYFNIIETWTEDFERNASDLLNCRGMLACGNTPGLSSGLMASVNEYYPYHYATGEEAWLLYPFWEHYLVTGDKTFLRNRLYPLMRKMGEFYEDFLCHKDKNGKYILTGSISPENQPSNLNVSLLNNSAFDVAGARWTIATLIKIFDILGIEKEKGGQREKYIDFFKLLPDYMINNDGAISEWGWENLKDNYDHRHLSHLMMVYPFQETGVHSRPDIYKAAKRALEMRDRYNYTNAGHGYLHAALIGASLHDKKSLSSKMDNLTRRDFYYSNLATSHYPDHGTFCTDVCHAIPAIMIEMLLGSDENGICLLPALPDGLPQGSLEGVKTRCGVTVESLCWDKEMRKADVILTSPENCKISLSCGNGKAVNVNLKKGKPFKYSMKMD